MHDASVENVTERDGEESTEQCPVVIYIRKSDALRPPVHFVSFHCYSREDINVSIPIGIAIDIRIGDHTLVSNVYSYRYKKVQLLPRLLAAHRLRQSPAFAQNR